MRAVAIVPFTLVIVGLVLERHATAGVVPARVAALSGQQAPGLAEGTVFSQFLMPLVDGDDRVCFSAKATAPDGTHRWGIWSDRTGALVLIAVAGQQAPGAEDGEVFSDLSLNANALFFNDAGSIAFKAFTEGTNSRTGIWRDAGAGLELVALEGQWFEALGAGQVFFDIRIYDPLSLNNSGKIAFGAIFQFPYTYAVFSDATGAFEIVFETNNLSAHSYCMLSDSGAVVHAPTSNYIYRRANGTVELIAGYNDPAPGMDGMLLKGYYVQASALTTLPSIPIDAQGRVALLAHWHDQDGNEVPNNSGLMTDRNGEFDIFVRMGDPAPGTNPPDVFNWLGMMVANAGAVISFGATFSQDYSFGRYLSFPDGTMQLLAKSGGPVPRMPDTVTYSNNSLVDLPAMNAMGQTAFNARVTGLASNYQRVLVATNPAGNMRTVAAYGDLIEVAAADTRALTAMLMQGGSGGADGRSSGLSESGLVTGLGLFTDGTSGIFVMEIPECALAGDLNEDSDINGLDIPPFAACLLETGDGCTCADVNLDGLTDAGDIASFVTLLLDM